MWSHPHWNSLLFRFPQPQSLDLFLSLFTTLILLQVHFSVFSVFTVLKILAILGVVWGHATLATPESLDQGCRMQVAPQTYWVRICFLTRSPGDPFVDPSLRNTALKDGVPQGSTFSLLLENHISPHFNFYILMTFKVTPARCVVQVPGIHFDLLNYLHIPQASWTKYVQYCTHFHLLLYLPKHLSQKSIILDSSFSHQW